MTRAAPGDRPAAIVIHGATELRAVLGVAAARGRAVTLLSAPGAGAFAGAGWWRALMALGRREFPGLAPADILDCADAPGAALAALRLGQRCLVLHPRAPGFAAVAAVAASLGAEVLPAAPPALGLAAWLAAPWPGDGDLPPRLG